MRPILLSFSFLFFFCGCQQELSIDSIEFQPRLVVNALFTTDAPLNVFVESSRNILDTSSYIQHIENATVLLKDEDGNLISQLEHMGANRYEYLSFDAEVGKRYTLEVSSEGYQTASATSMIPPKVETQLLDKEIVIIEKDAFIDMEVELRDNDDNDNFYVWEVVKDYQPSLVNEISLDQLLKTEILLSSEDKNLDRLATHDVFQSKMFLKDVKFANTTYETSFKAIDNTNGPVVLTPDEVFSDKQMRVVTASESMYKYYRSVESYRIKGVSNSSITDPVKLYSNVENGLGVFAGYNEEVIPLSE